MFKNHSINFLELRYVNERKINETCNLVWVNSCGGAKKSNLSNIAKFKFDSFHYVKLIYKILATSKKRSGIG